MPGGVATWLALTAAANGARAATAAAAAAATDRFPAAPAPPEAAPKRGGAGAISVGGGRFPGGCSGMKGFCCSRRPTRVEGSEPIFHFARGIPVRKAGAESGTGRTGERGTCQARVIASPRQRPHSGKVGSSAHARLGEGRTWSSPQDISPPQRTFPSHLIPFHNKAAGQS